MCGEKMGGRSECVTRKWAEGVNALRAEGAEGVRNISGDVASGTIADERNE